MRRHTVVGRVFTKTSSLNAHFLDLLCLDPDAVTSYQLGGALISSLS